MHKEPRATISTSRLPTKREKYLSDVKVAINDEHGNRIVETTTAGPWFYSTLSPRRYDVKASYDNLVKENPKPGFMGL